MTPLLDFAIIAAATAGGIVVLRWLDARAGRDSLRQHAEFVQALAPVVQLAPRRSNVSAVDFLLGNPRLGGDGRPAAILIGTSRSKVDRPTPTAPIGLAAVGEFEPFGALNEQARTAAIASRDTRTLTGSTSDALNPRHLRAVPSHLTADGAARLLVPLRATAPVKSDRRSH